MYMEDGVTYLEAIQLDSMMPKLPLIERVRLIFGCQLFLQVQILMQRHPGKVKITSEVLIEKIFEREQRVPVNAESKQEPDSGDPEGDHQP